MQNLTQFESDEDEEDIIEDMFLIFSLDKYQYGIEIKFITEIVGLSEITEIPDMPSFVKGVINLRGKVISLIDTRLRFGMKEVSYDEKTCIIILHLEGQFLGLIVDTVREVIKILPDQTSASPQFGETEKNKLIQSIAKINNDIKMILNIHNIVNEKYKSEVLSLPSEKQGVSL
ncbi:purine-binding chemotaxis protein CheW [Leptospira idonii]|uniref:Purine-binding chemotaxis protein CheW n=2 Tax=Leptospira idonii TaxID=1193500 RepID=A0A4R9M040_9LEPT|nr:purine-binding chemotaxis protein CheW [Leptospira idonii]